MQLSALSYSVSQSMQSSRGCAIPGQESKRSAGRPLLKSRTYASPFEDLSVPTLCEVLGVVPALCDVLQVVSGLMTVKYSVSRKLVTY